VVDVFVYGWEIGRPPDVFGEGAEYNTRGRVCSPHIFAGPPGRVSRFGGTRHDQQPGRIGRR
jgi:hypothetical protein